MVIRPSACASDSVMLQAPLFAKPRPSPEVVIEKGVEKVGAGVKKVGAAASSSQGLAAIDKRIKTIKAEYWGRKRLAAGKELQVDFKPMPPIMPPPQHLLPKHLGSPPQKKGRFES